MDTVSKLNKMRFYCQPILPLVYDESLSYYETLCKVVGQLNTTGDTVNKLNEGLTGEIADRHAADAELDERLKLIEATNDKIHFLVFDGANPNVIMPTRDELYNWVRHGDAIITLFSTHEEGRGLIYAASCSYNAGNFGSEASNDFSIIVPLETTYDSTGKLAVKQKIVKLTIPPIPQTNLNVPWGLQIIEIDTPHTSAEGIVNFSATVDNKNTVHASLSPAEFTNLYRAVSKGSGLIVGVNAQLTTNDSQLLLSTTADIIGGETASDDEVRIVFDAETSTGERGLDLPYLNRLIYILSGSGTDETWTLTEFETYDFAFDRYEGFQFTRATNNAITPAFGSTPKDVAEYFGTVKGGTPYQNLPVRLVDTVENFEYWNGVFHRTSTGRISYTFTTSYYLGSKMLVRIIELSATPKSGSAFVGDEKWVFAEKDFELPLETATQHTAGLMSAGDKTKLDGIEFRANKTVVDAELSSSSTNPVQNKAVKAYVDGKALPEPNPDGSDDGKVPTVVGNKWGLETPSGGGTTPGGSSHAVLYVSQVLTEEQKKQARENVDAAIGDFAVNATYNSSDNSFRLDKTEGQIREAISAGKRPFIVATFPPNGVGYFPLTEYTESNLDFNYPSNMGDFPNITQIRVNRGRAFLRNIELVSYESHGVINQVRMASAPTMDMQIATKKYVDDSVHSPNVEDMTSAWNPTVHSSKSGKVNIYAKHLFYYPGLDAVYFSIGLSGFEDTDVESNLTINMNVSDPINGISLRPENDTAFTAELFVHSVTGLSPNSMVAPAYLNNQSFLSIVLSADAPGALTSFAVINGWYLANNHSSN